MERSDEALVAEYLNECALSPQVDERLVNFHKIKEIVLHKSPHLLNKYLPNVLNFTTDKNVEVKKALVGFIEELCKLRESLIPKVTLHLHMLLCDEFVPVQKRVIQAAITIYRRTLSWLCKAAAITEEMEEAWKQLSTVKLEIANMIDSDNDGIRTSSVKFLECVVLAQTYPDEVESRRLNDFSLDDVPLTLKIARRRKLEEEASNLFEVLLKFHGSPHISSANLLTCLGVLTNIAKTRAEFMYRVIGAIESLHNNLPPTLTTTQVSSVKKKLKTELSNLLRHPAGYEYAERIGPMLIDLGCSQQEVAKLSPKSDERRRYNKRTLSSESMVQQSAKRPRLEPVVYDYEEPSDLTPLETNEHFILENLTLEKAIYLIFTHIPKLPNVIPEEFPKDYAEFVTQGRIGKIYLANVLAGQFLEAGVGPGAKADRLEKKRELEEAAAAAAAAAAAPKPKKVKVQRIRSLKLAEVTKPLSKETKERLLIEAVKRVLRPHKSMNRLLHQKIITTLATNFNPNVRSTVLAYLLEDLRSNIDVALAWLFEEYSILQGFSRLPPFRKDGKIDVHYNSLLCSFVGVSASDALILSRLLLESPVVTDDALDAFRGACRDERRSGWALGLLKDLAVRKPPRQLRYLNALLSYTTYEAAIVRENAIQHVLGLHESRSDLRMVIEEFARMNLEFLKLPKPPESLCGVDQGRLKSEAWTDEFIKACLLPYVSLLTVNEALIHDLSKVYIDTSPDIKRITLRLLEGPIKSMGMESQALLRLIEQCDKGSETLVTKVLHTLTDKGPPSFDLVNRVRDLYGRIPDIRFLIPVLNGLTKAEVINALPKLIKMNPAVIREVFNRLLGLHGDSPISPTELLVALHLIDTSKADLKTLIKATTYCVQERQVYTQEVLAVVLQQLMEQQPLPTLLMRTVMQALASYPRLSGFVMNILQRLILKKVWNHKVVWEGFVRCCQRTKPQSFTVLMQLPPAQLTDALRSCPELGDALRAHLMNFTEAQRSHIPSAVQEIVLKGKVDAERAVPPSVPEEMPVIVPVVGAGLSEPLPPGME